MKALRAEALNLRSWHRLELAYPDGICAIVGANGAGKSTALSIPDLALFGSGRELKRALSRGGADDCYVLFEFEHGDERYRVRRSYTRKGGGKSRLDFEQEFTAFGLTEPDYDWKPLTRETIDETEQDIAALLGISRPTYRASAHVAQGDGAAFTSAQPRERKGILLEALGVRLWDALKVRAAGLRQAAEQGLVKTVAEAEQAAGQAAQLDALVAQEMTARADTERAELAVRDLEEGAEQARQALADAQAASGERQRLTDARTHAQERLGRALARAEQLRLSIDQWRGREGDRKRYEAEQALGAPAQQAEQAYRAFEDAQREAFAAASVDETARGQAIAAEVATDDAVGKVAEAEAELRALEQQGATCPVCKQALAGEALEAARARLVAALRAAEETRDSKFKAAEELREAERVAHAAAEEAARAHEQAAEALAAALEPLPDALRDNPAAARSAAEAAGHQLAALNSMKERAEPEQEEQARIEAELPALRLAADAAAAALAEHTGGPDPAALLAKVAVAQERLGDARQQVRLAEQEEARAAAGAEQARNAAARAAALDVEAAERRAEVVILKQAEHACSRDGIPALILEAAALPQLQAEANRIIDALGRPYRFELRSQRLTAAGDAKEALDIVVYTEQGEAAYEDFSGGERTRLDLALRISLARLLAARRGADIRLLSIDEPSYLDDDGYERLAEVLRGLRSDFDCILVVSHEDELRDAFDNHRRVLGGSDSGTPSYLEEATSSDA